MVSEHDVASVPPAHPPLAPPTSPQGHLQAPSPPSFDRDPGPGGPGGAEAAAGVGRSRATAGLPPLPPVTSRSSGGGWRRPSSPVLAALAGALVVVVVAVAVFGFGLGPSSSTRPNRPRAAATRPAPLDVPALRRAVAPSVVAVSVTGAGGPAATSTGSGVIVTSSGLVVTTADLVADATSVQVVLADGRSVNGQVEGTRPDGDVAVIRLSGAGGVSAARLGRSSAVKAQDEVVAFGAPAQAKGQLTSAEGVVTATGQTLPAGANSASDVIRTDAPTPASAAGGPLVDTRGDVVGLTVAVSRAGVSGGYALGIDAVTPLVTQIEQGHADNTPTSPSLGVGTLDVRGLDPATVARYGVQTSDGAVVVHVAQPSAAAAGGLAVGDVITAVDAQPVNTTADLAAAVASHQAGDQVQVTYQRGAQLANVTVTLLARKDTGG